jgi:hypothetical protein
MKKDAIKIMQTAKRVWTINTVAGEHIVSTTEKMVEILANRPAIDAVKVHFNGIRLVVSRQREMTPIDVQNEFYRKMKAQSRTYRRSTKAKARKREHYQDLKAQKQQALQLIRRFRVMDKTSLEAVVAWLGEFQEVSDHLGAVNPKCRLEIVRALLANGYVSGVNTGSDYQSEDKENVGHYLVGQSLSMLQRIGAIHPMIKKWSKNWQEKFEANIA